LIGLIRIVAGGILYTLAILLSLAFIADQTGVPATLAGTYGEKKTSQ